MIDPRAVGRRIKSKRVLQGLSQAELGKIVGLSPRCVYDIERGEVRTSLAVSMRLIVILGLEPEDVIDMDDVTGTAISVLEEKAKKKAQRRSARKGE